MAKVTYKRELTALLVISELYGGKTYCFGDQAAHDLFMPEPCRKSRQGTGQLLNMFPTKAQEK
jgi:hypothetical protein